MIAGLTLPFEFEPTRLKSDLSLVRDDEWVPHYNERDYGGIWSGVALRSTTGQVDDLTAAQGHNCGFLDTPLLEYCHYFREVLSVFQCPLRSVRLLSLAPGSFIREHSDNALAYEEGEVRIHVPVLTNPDVEFYSSGQLLRLEEGLTYYVNVNLPHRVSNRGTERRVHLVIDAEVNEWVHRVFAESDARGRFIRHRKPAASGWSDFRRLIFQDASVREALWTAADRYELERRALDLGRHHGLTFTSADLETPPPGTTDQLDSAAGLNGWLPVRVKLETPEPEAEWIFVGDRKLTEPFFEDTVRSCLRNPFAACIRRTLPLKAAELEHGSQVPLRGFIFHMSRCGSTLITQMLASLPRTVVVSEAEIIDQVVQANLRNPSITFEQQTAWLRWTVKSLGRCRIGQESDFIVKLDAWHIHSLPLFRAAFPGTPWIFVFRNPPAVLASQLRSPGIHCLPGAMSDPRALRLTVEDITRLPREQWCTTVLENICRSALAFRKDPKGLFINYESLPGALPGPIAAHFGLRFTLAEIESMAARSQFHCKERRPWTAPDLDLITSSCEGPLDQLYNELVTAALSRVSEVPYAVHQSVE